MCLDFVKKKKEVKYNILIKKEMHAYIKIHSQLCLQNELIISASRLLYNMVNKYINIFAGHVTRKTMHIRCSIRYTNSSATHFTDKSLPHILIFTSRGRACLNLYWLFFVSHVTYYKICTFTLCYLLSRLVCGFHKVILSCSSMRVWSLSAK